MMPAMHHGFGPGLLIGFTSNQGKTSLVTVKTGTDEDFVYLNIGLYTNFDIENKDKIQ